MSYANTPSVKSKCIYKKKSLYNETILYNAHYSTYSGSDIIIQRLSIVQQSSGYHRKNSVDSIQLIRPRLKLTGSCPRYRMFIQLWTAELRSENMSKWSSYWATFDGPYCHLFVVLTVLQLVHIGSTFVLKHVSIFVVLFYMVQSY